MEIYGEKIRLRAVELKDLDTLKDMINNPEIESLVGGWSLPVSSLEQEKWIRNLGQSNNRINLVVTLREDDKCIGMINVVNIDWKNRNASLGIKLISEVRGKGLGEEIIGVLTNYLFEELNLYRLETLILEENKASKKLFVEKCGWEIEGKKIASVYKNGKYQNQIMVAILKN